MLITEDKLKEYFYDYFDPRDSSSEELEGPYLGYSEPTSIRQKEKKVGLFNTGTYENRVLNLYGVILYPSTDLEDSMEIVLEDYIIPSTEILSMKKLNTSPGTKVLSFSKVSFKINIEDIIPSPYSTK